MKNSNLLLNEEQWKCRQQLQTKTKTKTKTQIQQKIYEKVNEQLNEQWIGKKTIEEVMNCALLDEKNILCQYKQSSRLTSRSWWIFWNKNHFIQNKRHCFKEQQSENWDNWKIDQKLIELYSDDEIWGEIWGTHYLWSSLFIGLVGINC